MTSSMVPFAWVDDLLIAERKRGLQMYINNILHDLHLCNHPAFLRFLSPTEPEDCAVPNMASKGTIGSQSVLQKVDETMKRYIAASYYPSWSSDILPPESIDFKKFDILFFGK